MAEAEWELDHSFKWVGYPLSKDNVNLVYIPVGRMSKSKAEEYILALKNKCQTSNQLKDYKFLFIAVGE